MNKTPRAAARLFWIVAAACATPAHAEVHQQPLNNGWTFRALSAPEHTQAETSHPATVPGEAQTDLLRAGLVPNPFVGTNEHDVQWVGNTGWQYDMAFDADAATRHREHCELVFDGLDTLADVYLNDKLLLHADNMFRTWRADVTGRLSEHNTVRVVFQSPVAAVAAMASKLPYIIPGPGYEPLDRAKGIYPSSQYLRKAGYSFGWDWGPRLVTIGIWKPVHLDSWDTARITRLHLRQQSVTAERAITRVELDADATRGGHAELVVQVTRPDGTAMPPLRSTQTLDSGTNHFEVPLRVDRPQRWFPAGYGKQAMYSVTAKLLIGGRVVAQAETSVGLRSVELRREEDRWGKSFTFVINGVPVFAKGADFVPLDSFPPDVTPARRLAVLTAARDANMNMLRIWGGGYYEPDDFYKDADRLGIMVWHDFMFGGGMIPHDQHFLDNIHAEAAEQVDRLSDHPSMVLWCGNNELETAWNDWGDRQDFKASVTPGQREQVWQDYVVVFRDVLKSAVAKYGDGVPYWPSSPGADFEDRANNADNGDVHSWKVWSGSAPITSYGDTTPRFLSEFGFQSLPALQTIRYYAGNDEGLESPSLLNHEKFKNGLARMTFYMDSEYGKPRDFASTVYLGQLMQANAMKYAVETMRARRPHNMGTLYWQLDDCWPVASWASMDYFLRPKALQYFARRFYAPLLVSADVSGSKVTLNIVSDETAARSATLRVRLLNFDGTVLKDSSQQVSLAPLSSTDAGTLDASSVVGFDAKSSMLAISLTDGPGGRTLAEQDAYFAPAKDLALPVPDIHVDFVAGAGGYTANVRSEKLARNVQLNFGELDVAVEDNDFDVLPGERKQIQLHSTATLEALQSVMTVQNVRSAMQP